MELKKKITHNFYFWIYLSAFVLAILGLVVNNNTMTLNKKIQDITAKKKHLEEENEYIYLKILTDLSLDRIDANARYLGMVPPEKITVLRVVYAK